MNHKRMVFISTGHYWKKTRPMDRGAVHGEFVEGHEALRFSTQLVIELENMDIPAFILLGDYKERQFTANLMTELYSSVHETVFVSPHFNSGGGDYSLVLYDKRSSKGKRLSELILEEWKQVMDEPQNPSDESEEKEVVLEGEKVKDDINDDEYDDLFPVSSKYVNKGIGSGDRGWTIIKYTTMPAVILEPLFIDNEKHMLYWDVEGYEALPYATAQAIKRFFEEVNQ